MRAKTFVVAVVAVFGLLFVAQMPSWANNPDPGTNNPPPLGAILDLNGTPISIGAYQSYSVNFTGAVANTAITFALREDPAFLSLANTSVVDLTTASGNLLTNGDFSGGTYLNNGNSGTPNSWTYANIFGATFGGVVQSGSGFCYTAAFCWYDGAVQAYDAISQTIATNIGDTYQITFDLADNNVSGDVTYSDLSTNGDTTDVGGNGINLTVYAQSGIPLPGTPEPSTLLMFGSGLLTIGGIVRRRLSL